MMNRAETVPLKLAWLALSLMLAGCIGTRPAASPEVPLVTPSDPPTTAPVTTPADNTVAAPTQLPIASAATAPASVSVPSTPLEPVAPSAPPASSRMTLPLLTVTRPAATGNLQNPEITELSGLATSLNTPGVLFAINDSGRKPVLFAMTETGEHLYQWPIAAKNRDWEDMSALRINGQAYLVLADTGDNLQRRKTSTLHLLAEPSLVTAGPANKPVNKAMPGSEDALTPSLSIDFVYEDGPRNVEAVAVHQNTVFLISKEPVTEQGSAASRVYELPLPASRPEKPLTAKLIATLPIRAPSLEARLAASLAGVDLNHPTALDIDDTGRTAWVLTYRNVLKITRKDNQSWADAFAQPAQQILSHKLAQAEALTLANGRAVFFGSEGQFSPIWAVPVKAPL